MIQGSASGANPICPHWDIIAWALESPPVIFPAFGPAPNAGPSPKVPTTPSISGCTTGPKNWKVENHNPWWGWKEKPWTNLSKHQVEYLSCLWGVVLFVRICIMFPSWRLINGSSWPSNVTWNSYQDHSHQKTSSGDDCLLQLMMKFFLHAVPSLKFALRGSKSTLDDGWRLSSWNAATIHNNPIYVGCPITSIGVPKRCKKVVSQRVTCYIRRDIRKVRTFLSSRVSTWKCSSSPVMSGCIIINYRGSVPTYGSVNDHGCHWNPNLFRALCHDPWSRADPNSSHRWVQRHSAVQETWTAAWSPQSRCEIPGNSMKFSPGDSWPMPIPAYCHCFPPKNQPFRSYTINFRYWIKPNLKKVADQSIIPLVDWLATVASQHCQPLLVILVLPKSQSQITHQRKLEVPLYGYAAMFWWEIWCIIDVLYNQLILMHTPGGYTINKNIPVDSCHRVFQPKKKIKYLSYLRTISPILHLYFTYKKSPILSQRCSLNLVKNLPHVGSSVTETDIPHKKKNSKNIQPFNGWLY